MNENYIAKKNGNKAKSNSSFMYADLLPRITQYLTKRAVKALP